MRTGLLIVGALMILVGLIWTGQGANLIGGSFMTGQTLWLVIGLVTALVGTALVWWTSVGYRRCPQKVVPIRTNRHAGDMDSL